MRCTKCNVDLSQHHQACPLCGEKPQDVSPVIKDVRTAEYRPDMPPVRKKTNYLKISFFVYIVLAAVFVLAEKIVTGTIENSCRYLMVVPCLWAVIVRPFVVKKEYIGSYLILDVFYLSIASIIMGITKNGNLAFSLQVIIPICCITAAIIMTFTSMFFPKKAKLSGAYILTITVISLVLTVIGLFMEGVYSAPMLAVIAFTWSCVCVHVSYLKDKHGFKAQLQGIFHTR